MGRQDTHKKEEKEDTHDTNEEKAEKRTTKGDHAGVENRQKLPTDSSLGAAAVVDELGPAAVLGKLEVFQVRVTSGLKRDENR